MKMMNINKKNIKKAFIVCLSVAAMVALTVALAHAGEGGEEAATGKDWMWRVIDFAFIAGLLVYLLAKPFRSAMRKRIEDIENSLVEAKAAREEALKRLADVQARLKDKDTEIQGMLKVAEDNGKKERAALIQEGERMSEDIIASAKESIDAELLKAKDALRREAALMAVELAEKMVRENIKKEDQSRIIEEYLSRVGG